jgi:cytochrome c oxidase assembly factor CtaG
MAVALAAGYYGAGYHGVGYHGPPQLTLARAVTEWTFDPWACAFVLLLGAGYLAGVRRARRRGITWPAARTVSFAAVGLGTVVIAAMSWTGAYAGVLFYARATQTILLLLLAPLFLALGRPLTLAIAVAPGRSGQRLEAAIGSRTARVLTFPAITTLVLVVVPFVVYFSSWYTAYFHSAGIRELTYLALIAPGFVFFWTLMRADPVPRAYPYLVSLWITAAEVIGDAILGIAVIGDSRLIGGGYYQALARPWGPSLRFDQMLGGGTLWVIGDLVGLPFLAAQLIHMMREDAAEAAVIDAELDARDAAATAAATPAAGAAAAAGPAAAPAAQPAAAAPAAQPAAGTPAGPDVPPPASQPWWESDPRFTRRFSSADDQ